MFFKFKKYNRSNKCIIRDFNHLEYPSYIRKTLERGSYTYELNFGSHSILIIVPENNKLLIYLDVPFFYDLRSYKNWNLSYRISKNEREALEEVSSILSNINYIENTNYYLKFKEE